MRISRLQMVMATALTLAALPMAASAAGYTKLVPADSKVAFQYQQLGVKLDGHFKQFSGDIQFDPANPGAGRAALDVALASVDAGSPDADSEVVTAPWFNVEKFPKAHFESTSIKSQGAGQIEVAGKLSIKGVTRDVSFPATFKEDGQSGTFTGSLTIKRGDFSIGEGEWASTEIVAADVNIHFELHVAAK